MCKSIALLLQDSIGPAFDEEDLATALGNCNEILISEVMVDEGGDARPATDAALAAVRAVNSAVIVGVICVLQRSEARPLLRDVYNVTKYLAQACGDDAHLICGGVPAPRNAPVFRLRLWVRFGP